MEVLIILLGLGVAGIVVFFFKITADDAKREKNIESAKDKRLAELDAELLRKDTEMKKMMEERQKLEDEFFKARDEIDILKKENAQLASGIKQQEKAKEETAALKAELKQKEAVAHQETVARQKLQGELSLKEIECEKFQKELEVLKSDLKTKTEMYEGIKAQFNELEEEVQKLKAGAFLESPAQKQEKPVAPPLPPTVPPKESKKPASDAIPGFSDPSASKEKLPGAVPSDTDFLGSPPSSVSKPADDSLKPPATPFRFTNVNPVRNETAPPEEKKVSNGAGKLAPPPDKPAGA